MIDPTGRVIVLIRDAAAVAAITPRVRGGEKAPGDAPPFVIVRRSPSVPWIGDPSTESAGVMTVRYTALCYAAKTPSGERDAFVLAGAVADAINDHGAITFAVTGGRGVTFGIQLDSIGGALRDPDTGEPYVPVLFSVLAATQAVAA